MKFLSDLPEFYEFADPCFRFKMSFELRILNGRKVVFSETYQNFPAALTMLHAYFAHRFDEDPSYFGNLNVRIIPKPEVAG